MEKSSLELIVRAENLMYRIYPALINYPKAEKFSLCQDIKHNLYELNKNLALANRVTSKRTYHSQEADEYLETIRVLIILPLKISPICTPQHNLLALSTNSSRTIHRPPFRLPNIPLL